MRKSEKKIQFRIRIMLLRNIKVVFCRDTNGSSEFVSLQLDFNVAL